MTENHHFRPVPWLPGRHLQTIVPSIWPSAGVAGRPRQLVVPVAPGTSVRLDINHPEGRIRGTLLLVHGMGGSSSSAYMLRTARHASSRGWVSVRMNLRNCGGTEGLARSLYNAGQSADVGCVLETLDGERFPRPFLIAGFSLGGNIVLRYAALEGEASLADAVAAVSPPIDLERCARAIERPRNRFYQAHYTRRLRRLLQRILKLREVPGPGPSSPRIRSIRGFDTFYTAPDAGYPSAEAYYEGASSGPHLGKLRRPTMILSAMNDPFVEPEIFEPHRGNARIRFRLPGQGGHCGYWQRGRPRFWAAAALMDFFEERVSSPQ